MNRRTVMVLGGNLYSEPSVQSLKEAGFRIVLVDGNPDAPCFKHVDARGDFSFRDIERCLELAKAENIGAVLPTHDRAVVPSAQISKQLGLKGPSPEAAVISVSKSKTRQAWSRAQLPSPDFLVVKSFEEFRSGVAKIGFPAICKPTDDVGGGSRGVMKMDSSSSLEEAYGFVTSFGENGEALIEPFYEGFEHSVEILMRDGKGTVLMISDKIQTPPPYRVGKTLIYPSSRSSEILEKIGKTAVESALAVGLTDGAAHVELVSMENGEIILFEIGLRCGGGAIPHPVCTAVTGVNQFVEFARILLGESNSFAPELKKHVCWHFITAKPGRLREIEGFETASQGDGIIASGLDVSPGDAINPLKTSRERLGYFVSVGDTGDMAYEAAKRAETKLKFIYED
ncbi:MAG: ATP-grasp domain-containing protein [Nitrospinota bacterium]|nr:ATP-grasp domain-containing protein [Nitrospinota bacterium]